ncbi:MAG: excinuclease ABC subunit C [Desulfuromonas sp.]|nr:MAG: excinuclease ABC subunit C [Desulfuromonas sp.]
MKEKSENLKFKFEAGKYPTAPGVYLMQDAAGQVLYVGKAKNLRNRLRTYFSGRGDGRIHIRFLLEKVAAVETIVTDTEKEALLLENTLIKKHRPRYNIDLRDDKTYVMVRLDPREEFPALKVVRRAKEDGARYFGPYASAGAIRQTLKELYRIFPLRHHPIATCRSRGRPCLYYQIGQCSGPCHGLISREEYAELVGGVVALLEGREEEVESLLQKRMQEAAAAMRYEEAARLRDQIAALEKSVERQKVADAVGIDQDVFGLHREGGEVEIAILFVRHGKLIDKRTFPLEWRLDEDSLFTNFLQQFYGRDVVFPDELLLPLAIEDADTISSWLSDRRGKKVLILVPQRGDKKRLVDLANRNAAEAFRQRGSREAARQALLTEFVGAFHLSRQPRRIECYDISNIQGAQAVGSMAVLVDGEPAKREYRHYRIKTVIGSDDFASLAEVLRRRLERGKVEENLPDMILIDGGKGQLSSAHAVLQEAALDTRIDLVSIAKSRVKANVRGKVVEKSEERFFLPGRKNPVLLRQGSPALFLLERLRDEAHRFAITYHRKLRSKSTLQSSLEEIPGVGPGRRKQLLKHFGSLKKVKEASLKELQSIPGLSQSLAETIYNYFHEKK